MYGILHDLLYAGGVRVMSGVYFFFLFISGLYALILLRRPPAPTDCDDG